MLKKSYTILIVEDELLIAVLLKEMLTDLNHTVVGIAKNYNTAISILEETENIDLVFLDINLNDSKSGIDIARHIEQNFSIPFIFLSSYSDQKTIEEATNLHPHSYLVKPFTQTDLFVSLSLLKSRKEESKFLIVKDGLISLRIKLSEILWLKSENNYIEIVTIEKKHIIRNSLTRFLEESEAKNLLRVHKSFAINLDHVQLVKGQSVLINNTPIPISRSAKEELFERLNKK